MADYGSYNAKKRSRPDDPHSHGDLRSNSAGSASNKRFVPHAPVAHAPAPAEEYNALDEEDFMAFGVGEEMVDENDNANAAGINARKDGIEGDTTTWTLRDLISKPIAGAPEPTATRRATNRPASRGLQLPTVRAAAGRSAADDIDPALNLYADDPTAMQVTVGADGRIIINQESTVLSTITTQDVARTEVEGGATHITSATYARRPRAEKWTHEDVEMLYHALTYCGTDFSMVEVFFPTRTRAHVKSRFKKEEKENPERINAAITARKPVNVEEFKELIAIKKQAAADPEGARQAARAVIARGTAPSSPAPTNSTPATPPSPVAQPPITPIVEAALAASPNDSTVED